MRPDNLQLPSVQPSISSYKFQLPLGPHGHDGDGCHGGQCGHGGLVGHVGVQSLAGLRIFKPGIFGTGFC